MKKFENLPQDADTQILLSFETKIGETDCVFQSWIFDSIQGNSLIFHAEELEHLNDEKLKSWINAESEIVQNKSSMNVSRHSDRHNFVFVNFDFEVLR